MNKMHENNKITHEITFTNSYIHKGSYFIVASVVDDFCENELNRIWQYIYENDNWTYHDQNYIVSAITLFIEVLTGEKFIAYMSTEGHLVMMNNKRNRKEKIPLSGIFSEGAEGLGYMTGLNQIGNHLYACGGRGQVYKRLGPDQWVQMDAGIRQSVQTPLDECHHLMDINGPSEDAIYATANHGKVLFWNGKHWRQVETPTYTDLGKILVESPEVIWIAGGEGTLLKGNAIDGFINVSPVGELLFTDLVRHEGVLYLASNLGLYTFDEKRRQMKRVKTGLKPEHADTHSLGSKEGVLWSIGGKDIVRLKEGTWKRIDHGDNPPIR